MNLVFITQDEPIFLHDSIQYLVSTLPKYCKIKGIVLLDVSPYGGASSKVKLFIKTFKLYGLIYTLKYSYLYFIKKYIRRKTVSNLLKKLKINRVIFNESINHENSQKIIKNLEPDLLISIACNQILLKSTINISKIATLNLHCSLLPKHRGLMPSFWTLYNKDDVVGVTVFIMDEGIDTGDIITQKTIRVDTNNQSKMIRITKKLGIECIIKTIELIREGNYKKIKQDNNQATYNTYPTKSEIKTFLKRGNTFI